MRLVSVDNYNREGPGHDDNLLLTISDPDTAKEIATLINKDWGPESTRYVMVYPDDYVLKTFEP